MCNSDKCTNMKPVPNCTGFIFVHYPRHVFVRFMRLYSIVKYHVHFKRFILSPPEEKVYQGTIIIHVRKACRANLSRYRDYKTCSCSTQMSMKFTLLINVKMTIIILNAKYKDPAPPPPLDPRRRITYGKRTKYEYCTNTPLSIVNL